MRSHWTRVELPALIATLAILGGATQPRPAVADEEPCYPNFDDCTIVAAGLRVSQLPNGICIMICYELHACRDSVCGTPEPVYWMLEGGGPGGARPPGQCPGMPGVPEAPLCRIAEPSNGG